MNWVKVLYPEKRKVYIDDTPLGNTNTKQYVGEDAKPGGSIQRDRCARPPGLFTVLNAAATNPMENYSSDTVELARTFIDEWNGDAGDEEANREACVELVRQLCEKRPGPSQCQQELGKKCRELFEVPAEEEDGVGKIAFYQIHLRFDAVKSEETRRRLEKIPTRLQLPREDVDLLVETAAELLRQSPSYRCLLRAIGGEAAPAIDDGDGCPE